ncbi:MAG: hypothetical protein ACJ72W_07025 [Actinoallomurus sp.]
MDDLPDRRRVPCNSVAGFGSEAVAVLTYSAYALGSTWAGPGPLFAFAAVPLLVVALAARSAGAGNGLMEVDTGRAGGPS